MKLEVMGREQFFQSFKRLSVHEVDEPEQEFAAAFYYELYFAGAVTRVLLPRDAPKRRFRTNVPHERHGKRLQKCRGNPPSA